MKRITDGVSFKKCSHISGILAWGLVVGPVAALLCLPASAQQAATPPAQQQQSEHQTHNAELPPGPGRDTFIRVCSKCHSPNNVIANGQDEQGWENTITKMVGFGAVGTDAEFSEILDYLVKNFPPPSPKAKANVNKGSAAENASPGK